MKNNIEVPNDIFNLLIVNWGKMSMADRIAAVNKIKARYGDTERYRILCRMIDDPINPSAIPVVQVDDLKSFFIEPVSTTPEITNDELKKLLSKKDTGVSQTNKVKRNKPRI